MMKLTNAVKSCRHLIGWAATEQAAGLAPVSPAKNFHQIKHFSLDIDLQVRAKLPKCHQFVVPARTRENCFFLAFYSTVGSERVFAVVLNRYDSSEIINGS